jgi:hypothetical protein
MRTSPGGEWQDGANPIRQRQHEIVEGQLHISTLQHLAEAALLEKGFTSSASMSAIVDGGIIQSKT